VIKIANLIASIQEVCIPDRRYQDRHTFEEDAALSTFELQVSKDKLVLKDGDTKQCVYLSTKDYHKSDKELTAFYTKQFTRDYQQSIKIEREFEEFEREQSLKQLKRLAEKLGATITF
jgi:ATP-dependent RNA circularization protein (DNA/RNA ligase family)